MPSDPAPSDLEPASLGIGLDRSAATPLTDQIAHGIRSAIAEGRLGDGARLPSWRDLAAQLGVARGTVRVAYERLTDEQLIVTAGAAGTRVAARPSGASAAPAVAIARPLQTMLYAFSTPPLPFQMGVPAQDTFPVKLWSRLLARAARDAALAPTSYPDPRGDPELRARIAAYVAIARGIRCVPDQILVTGGFRGGLGLAIHALDGAGRTAWMEEPGFPVTRMGLAMAGVRPVPVPVDAQGLDVAAGVARAPDAAFAVVTAGQQAPLGMTLSRERRQALLRWAARSGGWVVEDDYLSELRLSGRAGPALAALDGGRVIHIGSFSKTLSPSLGLGFLIAPVALAARFAEVAACLAPAPNPAAQTAVAALLGDGHYLRHLRHMKRLYVERRDRLRDRLGPEAGVETMAGLAVLLRLPPGSDDVAIARAARGQGIAPTPLSPWYDGADGRRPGLLLGVTNLADGRVDAACDRLAEVIAGHG